MEVCNYNLRETLTILNQELNKTKHQLLSPIGALIRSQFIFQIFEGMNYLHSRDIPIIHRDLKLSNIIIKIDRESVLVKICDFGLSTNHERIETNGQLNSQSHTEKTGTWYYMAPEVKNGRKYNEKSDIYCIGLIILQMFDIENSRCVFEFF